MAIGIRIKLPGVTGEQFDKVNDIAMAGGVPEGIIFHASGPIEGGWGIIDFWESREQFDAFFGGTVQAAVGEAGVEMSGAPDIKEFPVHEVLKT